MQAWESHSRLKVSSFFGLHLKGKPGNQEKTKANIDLLSG